MQMTTWEEVWIRRAAHAVTAQRCSRRWSLDTFTQAYGLWIMDYGLRVTVYGLLRGTIFVRAHLQY